MDRRRFLLSVGAASSFVLAGCSESEAPPDGDDTGDGDDATDGVGDDDGDDGPTDGDDSDDGDVDAGDDTDNETTDDGDDADNESDDDGADGESDEDTPRLGDVVNWESSYEVEYEFEGGSGHGTVHESDSYWTWTEDGETVETYRVDEEAYIVIDGECFQEPIETPDEDLVEPDEMEGEFDDQQATGRTTVDGEEVYEFDIEGGTYYISVETGYPVQFVDDEGGTVTFSSWGDTDPISPPDMECESPPTDN